MTDILPTATTQTMTPSRQQASQAVAPDDELGSGTAISSDFDTFLRMLTAQVENQDPLNPLDSTDFAAQLATFSSVEQQVLTNDLLKDLSVAIGGNDLAQLSGWVGMEARAAVPAVFAGDPVFVDVAPDPGAARAELRVFDATGALWDQQEIPTQPGPLLWDGRRADGTPFPEGVYSFEVWSFDGDGNQTSAELAETYNRVIEVQLGRDGPEVLLGNGTYVDTGSISAIRSPAAAS
ncbi:MAG: flagellar hook capping FlgD N-terminal domain-containing protein [Pseudomonadota bacterium]